MSERFRRKKHKVRGERTHGQGDTKNNRGAGSRGGRGFAGANKHNWNKFNRFKKRDYRFKAYEKGEEISLGKLDLIIDELVAKKKVQKKGDEYIVGKESGFEKVMSEGDTEKKIVLRINASKKAIKKIIDSGGKFEFAKKNFTMDDLDQFDSDFEVEEAEGVEEK